jgi:hypothetical protein
MKRIGKLTVGTIVGVALTIAIGGAAGAAPATTTGVSTPSATPPSGAPPSTAPTSIPPTTAAPSAASPSTTSPGSPAPSASAPAKPKVLTGNEIWWIVRPGHVIYCAHAAKQVQRVRAADNAAAKRLSRWQTQQSKDLKIRYKNAAKRTKASSGKVKGFQKLEQEGQALISRIDTKCRLTSTTA